MLPILYFLEWSGFEPRELPYRSKQARYHLSHSYTVLNHPSPISLLRKFLKEKFDLFTYRCKISFFCTALQLNLNDNVQALVVSIYKYKVQQDKSNNKEFVWRILWIPRGFTWSCLRSCFSVRQVQSCLALGPSLLQETHLSSLKKCQYIWFFWRRYLFTPMLGSDFNNEKKSLLTGDRLSRRRTVVRQRFPNYHYTAVHIR